MHFSFIDKARFRQASLSCDNSSYLFLFGITQLDMERKHFGHSGAVKPADVIINGNINSDTEILINHFFSH